MQRWGGLVDIVTRGVGREGGRWLVLDYFWRAIRELRRRKRGRQADELESKWKRECCKTQRLRAEGRARNGGESNSDGLAPLVVREVKG